MLLIVLFAAGLLAVPLMYDIQRHGSDNILARTGEDILALPAVRGIWRVLQRHLEGVRSAFARTTATMLSLAVLMTVLWLLWRMLRTILGWLS